MKGSLKKGIYYSSISKIARLEKRKKQCKRFWTRKIYEKREKLMSFYTDFPDLKER